MKSIIKASVAMVAVLLVGESQQIQYINKKFLEPKREVKEEPCREPDFCYVPEVEFNENHPAKEVVGGNYTQAKLKEKFRKDFWYDNAKSDTPMPSDISYE